MASYKLSKKTTRDVYTEEQFVIAENNIKAKFATLHMRLDNRRDELLAQLQVFKKTYMEHCATLETRINDIKTAIHEMQEFEAKLNLNIAKISQKMAINSLNEKIKCLERDRFYSSKI